MLGNEEMEEVSEFKYLVAPKVVRGAPSLKFGIEGVFRDFGESPASVRSRLQWGSVGSVAGFEVGRQVQGPATGFDPFGCPLQQCFDRDVWLAE